MGFLVSSAEPGAVPPWQGTQPGPELIRHMPVAGTGPRSVTRLLHWCFRLLASSKQEAGELHFLWPALKEI